MRHVLLGFFLIVVGIFGFTFIRSGAWKSVQVQEGPQGPFVMIYKDFTGPYHKIIGTIREVETWAKSQGLDCKKSFGEYLDDPQVVEHERLKSRGGCLVEKAPANLPAEFKTQETPQQLYVYADFDGSPALGPLKVYGKIQDYMINRKFQMNGPVLEIYEVLNEKEIKTHFLFPVKAGN